MSEVKIGIHFWVPGNVSHPAGLPDIENDLAYVEARDRRLAEGPENQVLFVVRHFLHDTRDRFNLGKQWDGHIFETELGTPKPVGMSFKQAGNHILQNFPGNQYTFWGTELYVDEAPEKTPTWGCVLGAMNNLKLPNSKIDISGCWVNALPGGIDPNANILEITIKSLAKKFTPDRLFRRGKI